MSVQINTMMGLNSHKMEVHVRPPEYSDETWTLVILDIPVDREHGTWMFPQAEYRFWLSRDQLEQLKQAIEEALEL